MSKKHRHQPQPKPENTMPEVTQEPTPVVDDAPVTAAVTTPEPAKEPEKEEPPTLTAKQMALEEELNAARALQIIRDRNARAEAAAAPPELSIGELAAQGMDALHEAMRQHEAKAAQVRAYVPPPRTERQMQALQEELEAGRRAQQRAEAQQRARVVEPVDQVKEGFSTPVYRPDNMVPDPMNGDKLGPITGL